MLCYDVIFGMHMYLYIIFYGPTNTSFFWQANHLFLPYTHTTGVVCPPPPSSSVVKKSTWMVGFSHLLHRRILVFLEPDYV
mmetsp:Transcript_53427/g.78038  ORF Transcript_53427/g.78038 Transcript_53427/m.78038 type:complete len:81 (-) Transcript_53427:604-846(-)